ncbi:serine protease inhibitor ecotin [Erwinia sp. CPCC 100877]|nr:serine protease inhibitor ecotin [Erwinia sp. CPCC 100877]
MKKATLLLAGLMALASGNVLAADNAQQQAPGKQPLEKVAPYPKAEKGMTRQVIWLPKLENEHDYKIELIIGKTLDVDCNTRGLGGTLETRTLSGWGYNYLVVDKLTGPISTMMACPDNTRKQAFVTANLGDSTWQRYNSKLPLVIYAPEDAQVKYRIWKAAEEVQDAQPQ